MKSAREMFEELGYECDVSCDGLLYSKWVEETDNNGIVSDYNVQIHFEKSPLSFKKTKTKEVFNPSKPCYITLEELKAINKQVEELGWED